MVHRCPNVWCPKCQEEMNQLINRKLTIPYDFCSTCGGIWLEKRDLEEARKGQKKTIAELTQMARDEKEKRNSGMTAILYPKLCVSCQTGMLKETVIDDVTVDQCEHCGGMFLDKGEYKQLLGSGRSFWKKLKAWFIRSS